MKSTVRYNDYAVEAPSSTSYIVLMSHIAYKGWTLSSLDGDQLSPIQSAYI